MGGLLWRRGTFLPFPFKHAPPIVADVGIDVGMSLHEDQVCPGAAAASSSATRALRYFCCVAVTRSTSHFGRIARRRARLSLGKGREERGEGRGKEASGCVGSCPLPSPLSSLPASVVSGSGQSTKTKSRRAGRSRSIHSTEALSMPSNSGVRPGRQMRVGRVVVGRDRPVCTTSAPSRAFTNALLPVPVPPSVATTSGASSRTRSESARAASRRTKARHFSAGCQVGALSDQRLSRSTRASISARTSRCANSEPAMIPRYRRRGSGTSRARLWYGRPARQSRPGWPCYESCRSGRTSRSSRPLVATPSPA